MDKEKKKSKIEKYLKTKYSYNVYQNSSRQTRQKTTG